MIGVRTTIINSMIEYGSMIVWQCHLSLAVTTVTSGSNGSLVTMIGFQSGPTLPCRLTNEAQYH